MKMEYLLAASAGIGRVVGEDADWQSLDPQPKSASWAARHAVDPDAWSIADLEPSEDPNELLELERNRADAFRLVMILLDPGTSDSTFALSRIAAEELLASPEVATGVLEWLMARPLVRSSDLESRTSLLFQLAPSAAKIALKRLESDVARHSSYRLPRLLEVVDEGQAQAFMLWQWWNAIPDDWFGTHGRERFYGIMISSGALSALTYSQESALSRLGAVKTLVGPALCEAWPRFPEILDRWIQGAAHTAVFDSRKVFLLPDGSRLLGPQVVEKKQPGHECPVLPESCDGTLIAAGFSPRIQKRPS